MTAFKTCRVDDLLPFCALVCYFDLRASQLIPPGSVSEEEKHKLSNVIFEFFEKMSVELGAASRPRHHEAAILRSYQEALDRRELGEAFRLILSTIDPTWTHFDHISGEMLKILADLEIVKYARLVNGLRYPHELMFFLGPLAVNEKLRLGVNYSFHSAWAFFEIIRESLVRDAKDCLSENEIEMLQRCIEKMALLDPSAFLFAVRYFEYDPLFLQALGGALAIIDESLFVEYMSSIKISEYPTNESVEMHRRLLDSFRSGGNQARVDRYVEAVYQLWETSLDGGKEIRSIYVSDHADALLAHLLNKANTKKVIEQSVADALSRLCSIDVDWFESQRHQAARFYADLSKLYMYSFAWKQHGFSFAFDEPLHARLSSFLRDRRWLLRFYDFPGLRNMDDIKRMTLNFGLFIVL